MERDRWGLPGNMFGPADDTFFGSVGRIVLIAAMLEDRLHTLYVRMAGVLQQDQCRGGGDRADRSVPSIR